MPTIHSQASEAVLCQRTTLVTKLMEREFARRPELVQRYGRIGREKSLQDGNFHLSFLAQALGLNNRSVFIDYVAWTKIVLGRRNVRASDLSHHLECFAAVLREELPPEFGTLASDFVLAAVTALPAMAEDSPTFLDESLPLSPLALQYFEALRRSERHVASQLILAAVAAGAPVKEIYLQVFQIAQYEVGRLWQTNRITVAQEHYFTAATQLIMSLLYPQIFASAKNDYTLVGTCVAGDLHEIGVRMVADFFEMEGWNTYYLGANTPHASVVATVIEQRADVLAVSVTISPHLDSARELIRAMRENPATKGVKILVGGSPFIRDLTLWETLGADGSAVNAQQGIAVANRLMLESKS